MSDYTLENEKLCIKISNDKGGVSIRRIYDKEKDYEWVHTQKKGLSSEGTYDAAYNGGIECLFPTDEPCKVNGTEYFDHGFLWTTRFESDGVIQYSDQQKITFTGFVQEINVNVIIELILNEFSKDFVFLIKFENKNEIPLPYLFRLHPSIIVQDDTFLKLNGTEIGFEWSTNNPIACDFSKVSQSKYPYIDTEKELIDLERIGQCKSKEIFCHIKQNAGSFEVINNDRKMRITYDHNKLPILTLYFFNNDDHKVAIIEPATSAGTNASKLLEDNKAILLHNKEKYVFHYEIE